MSRPETGASAGVSGKSIRNRSQQEEEPSEPNILADKINAKLRGLINNAGAKAIQSNEGVMISLQASSSIFSYPEVPASLSYLGELNLRDRMDVRIASQGYSIISEHPSALVQPLVSVNFTLSPNVRNQALVVVRIEQRGDEPPHATLREEDPKLHIATTKNLYLDKGLLDFFLRSIDRGKPQWGGIEDYVEDLRELAKGKLTEEDFRLVEKALRIADVYLAGEERESGEPAIEHSYRSMRDALLAGVSDRVHLAVLALHDVAEDSPTLRQDGRPYQAWYKATKGSLLGLLEDDPQRERIVRLVMDMTSPKADGVEILNRWEAFFWYRVNMLHNFEVSFLKLWDHGDNVDTLDPLPDERQSRIIKGKTIPYIENLFMRDEVKGINPEAWTKGMRRLVKALKPPTKKLGIKIPPRIVALGR